jgi:hypothetical protein
MSGHSFEPKALITISLTVDQWNFLLRLLRRYGLVYKALPIITAISEQAQEHAKAEARALAKIQEPPPAPPQEDPSPSPKPPPAVPVNLASEKLARRSPRGATAEQTPSASD